jgi:gluconolactonase
MSLSSPIRDASPLEVRQPGSAFKSYDAEFASVLGEAPSLAQVVAVDAHEGPVYAPNEDALYFTTLPRPGSDAAPDFPKVAIKRLALDGERFPLDAGRVAVIRGSANGANGMAMDLAGRLVVCEQGTRSQPAAITRLDPVTGAVVVQVDVWRGMKLNSPNDVVVKSDGTVWFTDPSYGHLQGFKPEPLVGDYVYRYDPQRDRLSVVADSFDKPNGLAFSPDESVLYITDSGANQEIGSYYVDRPHHIKAFDVAEGRHLVNERLFAVTTPGFPDGIKVDGEGRVYASAFSGVQVFNPSGDLIGEIGLAGAVNFTFGGPDRNVLFITTDDAVWAAVLNAAGVLSPASQRPKGV